MPLTYYPGVELGNDKEVESKGQDGGIIVIDRT